MHGKAFFWQMSVFRQGSRAAADDGKHDYAIAMSQWLHAMRSQHCQVVDVLQSAAPDRSEVGR